MNSYIKLIPVGALLAFGAFAVSAQTPAPTTPASPAPTTPATAAPATMGVTPPTAEERAKAAMAPSTSTSTTTTTTQDAMPTTRAARADRN